MEEASEFQEIGMRLYVSCMLAIPLCVCVCVCARVRLCVRVHKEVNFCQTQPFIILVNPTYFDQRLIFFRCLNTTVFSNKVILVRSCHAWSKHQRVERLLDISVVANIELKTVIMKTWTSRY
jgi:hypothetical protein